MKIRFMQSIKAVLVGFIIGGNSFAYSESLSASVFNFNPYSFYNDAGELVGIMPDFIQMLSARSGIEIEIRREPYGRMLQNLQLGDVDFAIFFNSKKTAHISESLVKINELETVVTGLKPLNIQTYSDLKGLKIGIPIGVFLNPRFDNDSSLTKIPVKGYIELSKLLVSGRVDAIVSSREFLDYELGKLNVGKETLGEAYTLDVNEVWLRFSRKSNKGHLKDPLVKAALELLREDHYQRLLRKYLQRGEGEPPH